jgi:hypothetical protein
MGTGQPKKRKRIDLRKSSAGVIVSPCGATVVIEDATVIERGRLRSAVIVTIDGGATVLRKRLTEKPQPQ